MLYLPGMKYERCEHFKESNQPNIDFEMAVSRNIKSVCKQQGFAWQIMKVPHFFYFILNYYYYF